MPFNITFKIKNWKLTFLALCFICLFTALGCWQLRRAEQKKQLIHAFTLRTTAAPLTTPLAQTAEDIRFYQATLIGAFDNQHTFLLDNKIVNGQVGYEIYTPFKIRNMNTSILVDRGFVPMGAHRNPLPSINAAHNTTITGMLNKPPAYATLGGHDNSNGWPRRVEYINVTELASLLGTPLFHSILLLPPNHPDAFSVTWQIITMPPERHQGYAVQWFALALTLLILSVVLNSAKPTK